MLFLVATLAPFFGLGKTTIVSKLHRGKELKSMGDLEASTEDILVESALLISSCYGFESKDMTECRINSWKSRTSKARKTAPPLCSLPPTHETFSENVKRAHFQSAVWLSAMTLNLPNLDPTKYGWEQDKINEVLCLIGIPAGVSAAPPEVLKLIKCTCSSTKSCSTRRCSCVAANVARSLMCSCHGDRDTCCSEPTKLVTWKPSDDDVIE